jgi:hypothetical protein
MGKATSARRQACGGQAWLADYQPLHVGADDWAVVGPFVLERAARLEFERSAGSMRVVRALARLALWSLQQGLPLEADMVLDPENVDRFIATELVDDPSWATYRSVLYRLGPQLTKTAPWADRSRRTHKRRVAAPHSPTEIAGLRGDAFSQPTTGRRRAARALVALGAGAGLDGRWGVGVAGDDVRIHNGVVVVTVHGPLSRDVPVLAAWEDEVLALAAGMGDEFLVGGRSMARNRAGNLARRVTVASGHPKLSSARLRSTWLVAHLAMGTRLPELARAAGLRGVTVLSDLLSYVAALDDADALAMLRGAK